MPWSLIAQKKSVAFLESTLPDERPLASPSLGFLRYNTVVKNRLA